MTTADVQEVHPCDAVDEIEKQTEGLVRFLEARDRKLDALIFKVKAAKFLLHAHMVFPKSGRRDHR